MKNKYRAEELIRKYANGTCTDEERAIVESWHLNDLAESKYSPSTERMSSVNVRMLNSVLDHASKSSKKTTRLWRNFTAAAAVLAFIAFGIYLYSGHLIKPDTGYVKIKKQDDIGPGGNKAFLTLANGQKISLTDATAGQLALQSGVKITKTTDGQLIYSISGNSSQTSDPQYNTIETPNGGQYQVILPDGTRVWLNAASSLRFPTDFTGNIRKVELTGEGYFEVEPNATQPFQVFSNNQVVEVLGTHFNINTYPDEEIKKTTLIEGSIRVSIPDSQYSNLLKPGQQLSVNGKDLSLSYVDTELDIAWKKGLFQFKSASLETVMRQIARWYDVEIVYRNEMPRKLFSGKLHRDRNVSKILAMLSYYDVNFEIEGRKIIVNP